MFLSREEHAAYAHFFRHHTISAHWGYTARAWTSRHWRRSWKRVTTVVAVMVEVVEVAVMVVEAGVTVVEAETTTRWTGSGYTGGVWTRSYYLS